MKRISARLSWALPINLFACLLLTAALPGVAQGRNDHDRNKDYQHLGAYFEEWSIYGANYFLADTENSGAAAKLTHLLYAFANVTTGGQCLLADPWADYGDPYLPSVINGQTNPGPLYGNFYNLTQLKQLHPQLKVLISLGGASQMNTLGFQVSASTPALRQSLAASCINLFINGNIANGVTAPGLFDGIDLDWEFPTATDKTNFTALVQEFRRQLDALGLQNNTHYLLTIAAPAGEQNFSNIELAKVAKQLDFLNMETYDYHGTWETTTNHAAPLFDSPFDPDRGQNFNIEYTIRSYLEAGVPGSKMLLGIPFYGRGWAGVPSINNGLYQSSTGPAPSPQGDSLQTPGVATYRSLSALLGYGLNFDPFSLAEWLYSPTDNRGTFWTYENPQTIQVKMTYVKLRVRDGLGGGFLWALKDDDANATLVKTMADSLDIGDH
jgi:chitinase